METSKADNEVRRGKSAARNIFDYLKALRAENSQLRALLSGAVDTYDINGEVGCQMIEDIRAILGESR